MSLLSKIKSALGIGAVALAAATPVVAATASTDADKLKEFIKASTVAHQIVAGFETVRDPSLSGTDKMTALVKEVVPAAIALFADHGVVIAEAAQLEDIVRAAAQDLYNAVKSVTVGQLITLTSVLLKLL